MRIFVAGGTGAVGRRLVPPLVRQGHDVTVGTRREQNAAALRDLGARWYAPGGRMAGALAQGTLPANDAVSSFVHVDDAAAAVVSALTWPSGPVNIVDDEPAPACEWVPVLAEAPGAPVPERTSGRALWERGAGNTRAKALGWRPSRRSGF